MGHVTVRIHGKARNFLYCKPATCNINQHTFSWKWSIRKEILWETFTSSRSSTILLIMLSPSCSLFRHSSAVTTPKINRPKPQLVEFILCVHMRLCVYVSLPLHPQHWMKKLMRSRRGISLSVAYASIQSSMTICSDTVGYDLIKSNNCSFILLKI